ncbi:MAG: magnesium/cobalt transporter CorA [Bacteroidales bacterium]|jgi:magnesium transporter|nr:magnesium/cobalt transporter CorA [Bacteroidales bacterium]
MSRYFTKRTINRGKAPGSLVFIGERKSDETILNLIQYNEKEIDDFIIAESDLESIPEKIDTEKTSWLNLDALHNLELMKFIKSHFHIHPLLMEDILNTGQRPKVEDFDNCSLISMKMLQLEGDEIAVEQVSFVLSEGLLLSFQERPGDLFDLVRKRLVEAKGRIRTAGADYLCYALMDTLVDHYFDIIGQVGDKVEDLEDVILNHQDQNISTTIYKYKREFRVLHKAILPVRDMLLKILKSEDNQFKQENRQYLRDLLDLCQQALESVESYREQLSDYHNTYNTIVNNRMNDVMKVLTVFASIFIPLTFIAGVYGTNFENIPELTYKYAYFIMWAFFVVIIVGMVIYFKRNKWL